MFVWKKSVLMLLQWALAKWFFLNVHMLNDIAYVQESLWVKTPHVSIDVYIVKKLKLPKIIQDFMFKQGEKCKHL